MRIVTKGEQRKVRGMTIALDAQSKWRREAKRALLYLANSGEEFTADDLYEIVGLPTGTTGTNKNNAVGGLFGQASKAKQIVYTGRTVRSRRPEQNAADIRVWRGA